MAALSDYLEQAILNSIFRNTAFPAEPANVYIALYTAAPSDSGGGTEVAGNGYARVAVSTTGGWSAPGVGGLTDNIADITFPTASGGNWGTITHVAILDASSGGNFLFHGALSASKVVNDGDVFKFLAGALDVTLA